MKKIKHILFPTDLTVSSQQAFQFTLLMADKLGADLEVLHVVAPEYEGMDISVMAAKATQKRVEVAREILEGFIDTSVELIADELQHTANISTDIELGGAKSSILSIAQRDQPDLIVMPTHDDHPLLEKWLGTVTASIVSTAPCHVLVLPENNIPRQLNTLAYATDLKETDSYHIWEVSKLLEPYHPIMRCVHWQSDRGQTKPIDMSDLENFFADNVPALQINFHQLSGADLADSLNEFTDTWAVDLLVMSSPYRGFWERLFHASQTRKMALKTKVPLLIVREEG